MKHKKVWLLAGIPGSGKSTWVRQQISNKGGVHCSRDEIRFSLLSEEDDYFAHENEVIFLWKEKIKQAIENPDVENVYIDATHLTEKTRKKVLNELPIDDNCFVITVFFKVPLEICLERNEKRSGRAYVPPEVIRDMYKSYQSYTTLGDAFAYIDENGEVIKS